MLTDAFQELVSTVCVHDLVDRRVDSARYLQAMSTGGGLDSNAPYFVPPPSTKALRLSLVVLLIAPTLLIIGAGVAVAFRVW